MPRSLAIALAFGLALLALPAVAAADEAEPLFDPSAVAEIDFTLPPASLQKLEEEPETDEYQHAAITAKVGGVMHSLADVGFRLKGGHGSFRELDGKAAFKVKFNEFVNGQKLLGLKKLTLNNMVQDPSMVQETLTYELFRAMGLPAPRTGYASVRVNDTLYGTYLNLETYDDVMLPRFFPTTQHLYEADAPGTDVRTGEAATFEVDEGDDEDVSDLEALIGAVNDDEGDWSDNVSPFADLDEMTRAWGVERYVSHWDGYAGVPAPFRPNNYYLHSDEAGVFATMPWGTDQTWEDDEIEFDEPAGGLMFNRCVADASCRQAYLEGLSELRCVALDADDAAQAAKLAVLLAPYQDDEEESRRETNPAEIVAELESVEAFATNRPAQLKDFLVAEGMFTGGVDPCVPPSVDPTVYQVVMPPSTEGPTTAPLLLLKFGATKLQGNRVTTTVEVPSAGSVTQRVATRIGGRRIRACSTRANPPGPGKVTVSCHLHSRVREALTNGPLTLRVRIAFAPDGSGEPDAVRRVLKTPKRG